MEHKDEPPMKAKEDESEVADFMRMQRLREVFVAFDKNKDNAIDPHELKDMFEVLGKPVTEEYLKDLMHEFDLDQNEKLDFVEFARLVDTVDAMHTVVAEELARCFEFFDKDRDGYISSDELRRILRMRKGEAEDVLKKLDLNKDGKLDFGEFIRAQSLEHL